MALGALVPSSLTCHCRPVCRCAAEVGSALPGISTALKAWLLLFPGRLLDGNAMRGKGVLRIALARFTLVI